MSSGSWYPVSVKVDKITMSGSAVPNANSPQSKKLRVRKCGARLRVPTEAGRAETVYTCTLDKHPDGTPHSEVGVLHMGNNTMRKYTMTWEDTGIAILRQHHTPGAAPKQRTRTLK